MEGNQKTCFWNNKGMNDGSETERARALLDEAEASLCTLRDAVLGDACVESALVEARDRCAAADNALQAVLAGTDAQKQQAETRTCVLLALRFLCERQRAPLAAGRAGAPAETALSERLTLMKRVTELREELANEKTRERNSAKARAREEDEMERGEQALADMAETLRRQSQSIDECARMLSAEAATK